MATVYYDDDADLSLIQGRKIAVLGYGSQGHAHALSLRDSGCEVRVGLPEGSRSRQGRGGGADRRDAGGGVRVGRRDHGAHPGHRASGELYADAIAPNLKAGDALLFAHGFNIHFGYITAPPDVDVAMVAPKAPGHIVRRQYEAGRAPRCWSRWRRTPPARPGTWPAPTPRRIGGTKAGRAGHHVQGGDRERPVRRAGGAVRRRDRAGQRGLRDAGRRGLPARGGLLRVPARAQAHRRPDVRGRRELDVLLGQRHRRVRRPDPRPAGRRRRRPGRPWPRSWPTSSRASSPASGWPRTTTAGPNFTAAARARPASHQIEQVGKPAAQDDELARRRPTDEMDAS